MKKIVIIEKAVGQTPLEAAETWRAAVGLEKDIPIAYAGRLDPMASGKLLLLLGNECKNQTRYHDLDKEYTFEILLGVASDTGDVLGLIETHPYTHHPPEALRSAVQKLVGDIDLPYPHFSSKTVQGKPLHVWTLEGRINEIEIPTKQSQVHKLQIIDLQTLKKETIHQYATNKIETIVPVTETSKAIGNDFRRPDVRASWQHFIQSSATPTEFQVIKVRCIASSGTYMRTLADEIAKLLGTRGLAYSIHRTNIGRYQKLPFDLGLWSKRYR